jgi:hypothetical protein
MIPSNDLDWILRAIPRRRLAPPQPGTAITNTETPPPATPHTVTPDAVTDAVTAELAELHRIGVTRAQAVDSLHTVANELIQPLITPTPGSVQRSALACADALRAAATVLADHDDDPGRWTPDELQHGDTAATNQAPESPTPPTDTADRRTATGAAHRRTATGAAVPTGPRRVEIRAGTPATATPRPHLSAALERRT